jgi:DNA repair exonuclease SbcCD nuclease subunit
LGRKALLIGDLHFTINRFQLLKAVIDWMHKLVETHSPSIVINLGDFFNNHAVLRSEVLSEFRNHVDFITSRGIDYYYILGNHDFYQPKDSTYHALKAIRGISDRLHIIDKPIDIGDITFVPYMPDPSLFPRTVRPLCFAHQTFIGADYGYKRADVAVNADDVSADIIVSGHVHKRQTFGNVIYPGTPYAIDVDDVDQCKGITILDLDTYEQIFIESPFPRWRSVTVPLSSDYSIDDAHRDLSSTLTPVDNWVVTMEGAKAEIFSYINSDQYKDLTKKFRIILKTNITDAIKRDKQIKSGTIDEMLVEYVDKIYDGTVDKSSLLTCALDILKKTRVNKG